MTCVKLENVAMKSFSKCVMNNVKRFPCCLKIVKRFLRNDNTCRAKKIDKMLDLIDFVNCCIRTNLRAP